MLRYFAALGAGLLIWLAFPGHDLWWTAPLGIGLLAAATRGASGRRGFALGYVAGLALYLPLLSWSGTYVGNLPWVALCALQALYVAFTGWVCALLQRPRRGSPDHAAAPTRPAVVATAWMVGEWLRSTTPFGGFPWTKIAFSQADSPMLPLVRYVATPGLTFLVALAGATLAAVIVRAVRPTVEGGSAGHAIPAGDAGRAWGVGRSGGTGRAGRAAWALIGVPAVVAATIAPSALHVPTDGPELPVLAVQGNVPQAGLDFNAQRRAVLDNHVRVTDAAAAQVAAGNRARPAIVFWPENASDIDPTRNADAGAEISDASQRIGAPILVGGLQELDNGSIKNTSWVWSGTSGPVESYSKRHPVPFGEYIPYRSFFRLFSDKVDLVAHDFVAGDTVGTLPVSSFTGQHVADVGIGICFEVAYDDIMKDTVDAGADLLTVQTNNATFGYTAESYQQLATSRIRAVELGRSVVHISTVGTSGLITPDGVVHDQTGLFTPAALSGSLPLRTEITPATYVASWPCYLGAGALALLLVGVLFTRRRGGPAGVATEREVIDAHAGAHPDIQRA